ncbi:conserved exported hypothetical protein [Candidatus Sulfopaludibacter sp. SbA3]|nr:conserved exported hypothetical protein [Candidatus Sulfopaludibacter sp. SbA3]
MKTAHAILTAALALALAGCVASGKPKTHDTPPAPQPAAAAPVPAPLPEPLSLPQTQVQLGPEQPIDKESYTLAPAAEVHLDAPPASRSNPRPRPRPPAATPAVEPPAPPPTPPETERGPVRELLSPAESNRLKASADTHKREVRTWLNGSRGRRLAPNNPTVAHIQLLLKTSDDAEAKGDMREASDLADRALVLMRELQNGR